MIEEYLAAYGSGELEALFAGTVKSGNAAAAASLFARFDENLLRHEKLMCFKKDVSAAGIVESAYLIGGTRSDWTLFDLEPALKNGHLRFVQWAFAESVLDPAVGEVAVAHAAESGSVELVRWLVNEKGCTMTGEAVRSAAEAGRLDMLRWLHEQVSADLQEAVRGAARYGHVHVLEWLVEQGVKLTDEAICEAAESSTAATVAWLLDNGCPYDEEDLMESACMNEETDGVLKFLIETKRIPCSPATCREAASEIRIFDEAVLHRAYGIPLSENYVGNCVALGDISRLRYGLKNNAPVAPGDLCSMFNGDECTMLYETLDHYSVKGQLADEFRTMVLEAERVARRLSEAVAEVIARFGLHVLPKD